MSILLQFVRVGRREDVAKDYKFICRLDRIARERAAPIKKSRTLH